MNVSLPPEFEELVNSKVASGAYHSASDVIQEGLRLLNEHDRALEAQREELRREIAKGFDAINRGEFTDYDRSSVSRIADEIKSEGRRRAETRANRSGNASAAIP